MRKKYIFNGIIAIVLTIITVLSIPITSSANDYSARYAWRDDNGNIIFRALDKKATSNYRYMTVGYTITRCTLGTQNAIDEEYFTYLCPNPFNNESPAGGGLITTDYVLSETEFLSNVASTNAGWLSDIKSGETCWIKIDAIMVNVDYETMKPIPIYSGWLNSKTNQDYTPNPIATHPGVWDKFTKDDLVYGTYAWADPKKIYNHFGTVGVVHFT